MMLYNITLNLENDAENVIASIFFSSFTLVHAISERYMSQHATNPIKVNHFENSQIRFAANYIINMDIIVGALANKTHFDFGLFSSRLILELGSMRFWHNCKVTTPVDNFTSIF